MTERIRELALLAGLLASAGLFFWSTTLAKGPEQAAPAGKDRGHEVGEVAPRASEAPVDGNERAPQPEQAPSKPRKQKRETSADEPPASGSPATAKPASRGSGGSAPRRERAPAAEAEPVARLVNVRGTSATVSAEGVTYRFRADSHKPVANQDFTIEAHASRGGRGLDGTVTVDVVHSGEVVGHIDAGSLRRGAYSHTVQWPERSAGHPLTLKVSVKAGGRIQTFLFEIQVKSAA